MRDDKKRIVLGHGGGGRLGRELIDREIVSRFGDGPLAGLPDGTRLKMYSTDIVFSTDSFVVQPLIFPGGDIGNLAVHGTVNDLAVSGSTPRWLSLGMILEEGLDLDILRRVLDSVKQSAQECGVQVVTGDTKVVSAGQCDGMYLNTAGIGEVIPGFELGPHKLEEGDLVISSGSLGDHGMAIMAAREGIRTGADLLSDTGSVHRLVAALTPDAAEVRFMRDPTRGGAAAVLSEMVEGRDVGIVLDEEALVFSKGARSVAEVLGLDLLHVASEGRMLAVCSPEIADKVLGSWKALPEGAGASIIGKVTLDPGRVMMETAIGGRRLIDVPQGELLPRIC